MFEIGNIIWVVPGVAGLLTYNSTVGRVNRRLEGWPYFFAVVFFALPYYIIINTSWICFLFNWIFPTWEIESTKLLNLFSSVFLSCALGAGLGRARYLIFLYLSNRGKRWGGINSVFHDYCNLWRLKVIFITLRNRKVYVGVLYDYTRDPVEEPAILLFPIVSGYRDWYRKIQWTFKYPVDPTLPPIIIPYKEIVTFSLWSHSEAYTDVPRLPNDDNSSRT